MKQGKRFLRIASFIAALFIVSGVGMAQIQIEWPDPTPFGNTVEMKADVNVPVASLNLGTPGGPQTWNFDETVDQWTVNFETIAVAGTPYEASFGDAEWVDHIWMYIPATPELSIEENVEDMFSYRFLDNGWIKELGFGTEYSVMPGSHVYDAPSQVYPNPLTYTSPALTEWTDKKHFEPDFLGSPALSGTVDDSSIVTVDAWGELTVPSGGPYQCLRLKRHEFRKINMPLYSTTIETYTYVWLTEDFNQVLSVTADQSDGEDFTTALYVFLANTPLPSDVDEGCDPDCDDDQILPDSWNLGQNYPNPFNPTTTIRYVLPQPAQVELKVFSMLGQEVATLELSTKTPGEHLTLWDGKDFNGKDIPGGVYFYRLKATSLDGKTIVQTKKMIMTK